ncbi:hypothetical protein [Cellulosimicrobium cellulans]|uniref:hypothetical protein n=1 Tax=Cellulosimicrobium cellulans TaxID=1710 RepID=UPI001495FED2|nr:hypothetical protein [Cellulosimicrobium cellulans]
MRAAPRAVATVPLAAVALAGLVVLAAPAVAADGDRGGELAVTADGVSFDATRLGGDGSGWLSYAVTALDGSHTWFLGDRYTTREAADGHLDLDVPRRGPYRDGWCVTWVHMNGLEDQFAGWAGDAPACTTTTSSPSPEPPPAPSEPPAPPAPPPADPAPPAAAAALPAPPAQDTAPEPEPEPSETPTPTPTPTETPTPTASPTPEETEDRPEPARTPLVAAGERGTPPPPGETFPVLAVAGVGGLLAAAAGGVILLLRRVV